MQYQRHNQHLLWRAAFGPIAEHTAQLSTISPAELWKVLVKASDEMPEKFEVAENLVEGLFAGIKDLAAQQRFEKEMKAEVTKKTLEMRKNSGQELKSLNLMWLEQMVNSKAQLREKMSLFWHGHFACRVINGYFQQELIHEIRSLALGNFGDLLMAVSKSPAMLQYLNNQQNRRQHPNENFAREVMELFTLGRGNYTETDVKEAARAFTGWGFNSRSQFVIREHFHDKGVKNFLGKSGNFSGDDVIMIILENPQTARFITQKIYRYFVNEDADTEKVDHLAARFYQSNYNITALLTDIFTADWFYADKNIGNRIKSPVELIAGIRRILPLEPDNENSMLVYQKVLGQTLFYPPNVAGWPGGKSWIDSSSLLVRMQIPRILAFNDNISISAKSDDDQDMGRNNRMTVKSGAFISRAGSSTILWEPVLKIFDGVPDDRLSDEIAAVLLQTYSRVSKEVMQPFRSGNNRDDFIKSRMIQWMCTPEYQMC